MKSRRTFTFLFLILVTSLSTPLMGVAQEKVESGYRCFPPFHFRYLSHRRKASLKRMV